MRDSDSCDRCPDTFSIGFYDNSLNPIGISLASYEVLADKRDTGIAYTVGSDTFTLYRYDADIPATTLSSGWISIAGTGENFCAFQWLSSEEGDYVACSLNCISRVLSSLPDDRAFCLSASPSHETYGNTNAGGGLAACSGTVTQNYISFNQAFAGAALYNCDGDIRANMIVANRARCIEGEQGCIPVTAGLLGCDGAIESNTIYGNVSDVANGDRYPTAMYDCHPDGLRNNIIWANARDGAHLIDHGEGAPPHSYSCIEDWTSDDGGSGNTNAAPELLPSLWAFTWPGESEPHWHLFLHLQEPPDDPDHLPVCVDPMRVDPDDSDSSTRRDFDDQAGPMHGFKYRNMRVDIGADECPTPEPCGFTFWWERYKPVECPVVSFDADTSVDLRVAFTDLSWASEPIVSWDWNFGAGSLDGSDISHDQNPTWTYPAPGFYKVTLTITTVWGSSATTTDWIPVGQGLSGGDWIGLVSLFLALLLCVTAHILREPSASKPAQRGSRR